MHKREPSVQDILAELKVGTLKHTPEVRDITTKSCLLAAAAALLYHACACQCGSRRAISGMLN